MADRLTQLQDAVNSQAENFTNSLGILQQLAVPSQFPGFGNKTPQQQQNEDHTILFAQLIARTAKDIEVLIESLPNEESSTELQSASLQKLEEENLEAANKLEEVVKQGEATLKEIQAALHDIAQAQLDMQRLEETKMAELYDDEDFYGAGCEMDDQLLIIDDTSDNDLNVDEYERDFLEKQAEYNFGNENISVQEYSTVKKLSRDSRNSDILEDCQQKLRNRKNSQDGQIPQKPLTSTIYPPERRPPIFDFFTVLTAFIVAVILAYYTISSY